MTDELDVFLERNGTTDHVGHAWFTPRRGGPVSTVFSYTPDYLADNRPVAIDPALRLVSGNQYVEGLPGAFQDCAPDRWGRNLIDKQHRLGNRGTTPRTLNDADYLTRVSDRTRQGAIRFAVPGDSTFVDPDDRVPKLIELPRLLAAANELGTGGDDVGAVKTLLDAGSASLGGARPKASVIDDAGRLSIAKFPHREDEWDVMGWECVALDVAAAVGIQVPERRLVPVSGRQRVLLVRRFDRSSNGSRLHYISAMTALSSSDGQWSDYTDIAEVLTDIGATVSQDLVELYRRAAVNVALHNTDDHLRNHGFLHARGGWTLAPVFDVNPNPDMHSGRVTGIAGATLPSEELDGLRDLAELCRIDDARAAQIRSTVAEAIDSLADFATRRGIDHGEIGRFIDATVDVRG